jgi:1-acyl-sn-glycerol-3-phosphate acyltransferase
MEEKITVTNSGKSVSTTIIVIGWTIAATAFLGMCTIVFSYLTMRPHNLHKIARIWAGSILWVARVRVVVSGLFHLDSNRSYIFAANHQSTFDIPILLSRLPAQFRWIAKEELFRIPIFGPAMRKVGYISIDRSNRRAAIESLNRAAEQIRNGVSVLIFPEGTRSRKEEILPFKKGGFVLAIQAQATILPVVITGTRDVMDKGDIRIRPREVHMRILPPVDAADSSRKGKDELIRRVRNMITDTYQKDRRRQLP